jgi:hypothetical protein
VSALAQVLRLPARAAVLVLRAYQLVISPMYGPVCRYAPSCSSYAVGAIDAHGLVRGSALAAWRLLRCNPWSPGGYDPVPAARAHSHQPTGRMP